MIYIAAPFFNADQVATVAMIEAKLDSANMAYFSPRSEGTLLEMTSKEKIQHMDRIFKSNIDNMVKANIIIAVIDGRDIGTIWEMGFAYALGKTVISYTNMDHGLNVMLAKSVQAHVKSMVDLMIAIDDPEFKGELVEDIY